MIKKRIMSPGPVEIPPSVLAIGSMPIIHHRTPEFRQALKEVEEGLRYVFATENRVLILTSSGTGAMEGAVSNLTSPEDKVIVASSGHFGNRWHDIANAFNLNVIKIESEWGETINSDKIKEALSKNPDVKAVYTTLSETSTGVENNIEEIGEIVKESNAVLVVDAISGIGAIKFKADEWHVDCVVAGSQKALMIPPGLAFVSLSSKAWGKVAESKTPKFYFSFEKALKSLTSDKLPDTPYTSAVSLILQLQESLKIIKNIGIENNWKNYAKLADATRTGISGMGLTLFAKQRPSNAVTSVYVPEGIDGTLLVKKIRDEYGISIAGGQGKLKGKIFRIGHLGYIDRFDIISTLSAVEMTLVSMGYKLELGKGVKAAEEVLK